MSARRPAAGKTTNRSFIVRLWRSGGCQAEWQACVVDLTTGEKIGFATIDALLGYLEGVVSCRSEPDGGREGDPSRELERAARSASASVRALSQE